MESQAASLRLSQLWQLLRCDVLFGLGTCSFTMRGEEQAGRPWGGVPRILSIVALKLHVFEIGYAQK